MHRLLYFRRKIKTRGYLPVVLITGCASGVGLALAELFHKLSGFRVLVTARDHSIASLKNKFPESDRFWVNSLDVTNPKSREQLIAQAKDRWGGIDILINNAGVSYRAVVEDMTEEEEWHQMNTNYHGPMALIRLVLPFMREKGRGKIINVSSVSGMLAMPTMASYSASKYALEGASEALWYEMRPFGVDVSLIQPGFIRSKSFQKVKWSEASLEELHNCGPYAEYYEHMTPFVEKLMGLSRTPPEKVAKTILQVVKTERPPLWIPATLDAFFFYYLRRLLPRRYLHKFLYWNLPGIKTWGKRTSKRRPSKWFG